MALPEELEEKVVVGMWDRGLIGFFPEPGKKLKSGRLSPYYHSDRHALSINAQLDRSGAMSRQAQLEFRGQLIEACALKLEELYSPYEHVIGKAQAATCIGGLAAVQAGKSYLWERVDEPGKTYGAHEKIEGDYEKADRLVGYDNVITDGQSKIEGMELGNAVGLETVALMVQFDREEGGAQTMQATGVEFSSMTTLSRAADILVANRRMTIGNHISRLVSYHEGLLADGELSTFIPPK